jgi:bacterioferritin
MIKQDIKGEENAVKMYKQIIEIAQKEEDVTTASIFKQILEQEEEHHDTFTTLFEEI